MLSAVVVLHLLLLSGWAGAMGYSLLVVQPRIAEYVGGYEDAHESLLALLAHGYRWRVVSLLGAVAVTGAVWLVADPNLWAIQTIRGVLLAAAAALLWWVSWRHWPMRVFAIGD